jgi:type IV pilus assembly protein PilE
MEVRPPQLRALTVRASAARALLGFTLIELMIAMAIIAILSVIAIPAYTSYVTKSKSRTAQSDLVALSLNMENYFQQQLSYPATSTTTAATKAYFAGWNPAQAADFRYTITNPDTAGSTAYLLSAVGTSTALSGCTITLNAGNARTATSACKTGSSTW